MKNCRTDAEKQAKKSVFSVLPRISMFMIMFVLLLGALQPKTAQAATQAAIDAALTKGITWLISQQNATSGYFTGSGDSFHAANTGFAVAALEHYAEKLYKKPLDADFAYRDNVQRGLDYLLKNAVYDAANGWVYWNIGGNESYQSGIPLMAIARSGTPEAKVTGRADGLNGKTYKEVAQMAVNWLYSAQVKTGTGNGGWYYYKGGPSGDQSASGWVSMGLGYAKHGMGATIPADLLTRLTAFNNVIQSQTPGPTFGGAAYMDTSPSYHNIYKTGGLLFQQGLVGYNTNHQRVKDALKYMDAHWADPTSYLEGGWRGNPAGGVRPSYSAMFSASKGFTEHALESFTVPVANGGTGIIRNWYNDFSDVIVANQGTNGSWIGGGLGEADYGAYIRSTSFAILVLERAQSHMPPVVTSSPATSITTAAATINGSLTSMGTSTSVNVIFQYGTAPGVYTMETAPQTFTTAPSNFTVTLNGLALNTTFYYRSKAVGTAGTVSTGTGYSAEVSFTTPNTLTYTPAIANGTSVPAAPITGIAYPGNMTEYPIVFSANAGYHLTGVSSPCGGTATPALFPYSVNNDGVTSVTYLLSTPATTSCVVTATTAPNVYTITASASDNLGAANVGGSVACPATAGLGADPLCTFSPATGYHVYDVIVDGTSVWSNPSTTGDNTTLASRALGATSAPRTVVAKFRLNTYLLSTAPEANGSITPANGYGDYGVNTVTVNADPNYYITAISGCGGTAYTNAAQDFSVVSRSYTTGSVTAPCTVTASFAYGWRPATVTLQNLRQDYTGQPLSVSYVTEPAGLTVDVSYSYKGAVAAPVQAGVYAVTATVNDTIYQGSSSGQLEIVDTRSPVISLSTLAGGSTTSERILNIAGSISDSDSLAGVRTLLVNGQPVSFTPADGSFSSALALHKGSNSVTVTAVDFAGHTTTLSRNIGYDSSAPAITITAPVDNSVTTAGFTTVSGSVAAGITLTARVNGSDTSANLNGGSFSFAPNLSPGQNTIELLTTDPISGKSSASKRTITFAGSALNLAITTPDQDNGIVAGDIAISGSADPAGSTIAMSVNGADQGVITPGVSFSKTVTLPQAETAYSIAVTATDGGSRSSTVQRNILTAPPAPVYLRLTKVTDSYTIIAWNNTATTIQGSYIERSDNGSDWNRIGQLVSATGSQYLDNGLTTAANVYRYRVQTYGSTGVSGYSNILIVNETGGSTPALPAPTGFSASAATPVALSWAAPQVNPVSYVLERALDAGFTVGLTTLTAVRGDQTSSSDAGVQAGILYHYRLAAENSYGRSPWATTSTTIPGGSAPVAPVITQIDETVPGSALAVVWDGTPYSTESFTIQRATDDQFTVGVQSFSAGLGAIDYNDTGVLPDTTYWYRVQAHNTVGPSGWSIPQSKQTSLPPAPGRPTGLVAKKTTATYILLGWVNAPAPSVMQGTNIYRSSAANGPFQYIGRITTATGSQYLSSGLSKGATYYYQLKAYNGNLESAPSDTLTVTVPLR